MDLHHTPVSRSALFSKQARFACPVDIPNDGARGRTCTCTGEGLGFVGLLLPVMMLAMSLFSGPQLLRNDLRQDLPAADVLKMFPMPGWQIVLGEVLAPAAMLAGVSYSVPRYVWQERSQVSA